jgi:hypothetical protein
MNYIVGNVFRGAFRGSLVLFTLCSSPSFAAAQTCVQPPSGITGWWPGDGNSDDIVGGRTAVLRDNATFGPGLVDQGFILDGIGDFVDVPHDPALNVGTGDFTVDFWVNFNNLAGEQILVEKYVQETFDPSPIRTGWSISKLEDNVVRFFGRDVPHQLRPEANAKQEATKANKQALEDMKKSTASNKPAAAAAGSGK